MVDWRWGVWATNLDLTLTDHEKTCLEELLQLGPKPYKLSLNQCRPCDCVTDESPTRGGSISKWWSLPSSLFRTAIFFKWAVLAIPPRRPPSEDNQLQRVCQLFEKLTAISNCSYYSHLWLLEQLYFKSPPWLCIILCQYEWFCSTRHSSWFHTPMGRPVLVLGFVS